MPPEQIQKYMSKDYKDIAEITAYHSLMYLKNKLNINHEFFKGWKDALVGGKEIYYIGIVNGEPCLERINPIYFDYDTETSDLEFVAILFHISCSEIELFPDKFLKLP